MEKTKVLVVIQDVERLNTLRNKLAKALPHCSFVFETTMRDASDSTSLVGYKVALLGVGSDENDVDIEGNVQWLKENCPGASILLHDPDRVCKSDHRVDSVIHQKLWFWVGTVINELRRLTAPSQ